MPHITKTPSQRNSQKDPSDSLRGKRILLTRQRGPACPLNTRLTALGAQVLHCPLITIAPVAFQPPNLQPVDWLFFTSKTAVHSFFTTLKLETDIPPIAVVGPGTAQALESYRQTATFISPVAHAQAAAECLTEAYQLKHQKILWPCARNANQAPVDIFLKAGATINPLTVYETVPVTSLPPMWKNLTHEPVDAVVFTSPSAIDAFAALNLSIPGAAICCLGPSSTKAAVQKLNRVDVTGEPHTFEGLAQSLLKYFELKTK